MSVIVLSTSINAPIQTCFDLTRSIDLHLKSTAHTKERVVAGRASGLCEVGDTITWEAVHFGIRQRLSVKITQMNAPAFFQDEMTKGAFRSFTHQHIFEAENGGTLMKDVFTYKAPLGLLGRLAEWLVLNRHMKNLLQKRNATIKMVAEGNDREHHT